MKKFFKKYATVFTLSLSFLTAPALVSADAAPGDVIITLGENLTDDQKAKLLSEMGETTKSNIIYVTNEEEHKYLDKFIPKAQIGTRALSSVKITYTGESDGLTVETNNINYVTDEMYNNALVTAGIKTGADIYVTAPFPVSGTAALTGIIKAYEISTGDVIPEEQKEVANEEMVKTAKLGDAIGDKEKATDLMNLIKAKMAENTPATEEEVRQIVEESSTQLNIPLTEEQINGLVELFNRMKELNIDWNAVGESLTAAKEKFDQFLQSEEGQNFMQKLGDFFTKLIDAIKVWFS